MRKQGLGRQLIAALLVGVLGANPAQALVQGVGGEAYSYAASGNLLAAGASSYAYEDPSNAQAVTRIVDGPDERLLDYDQDGHLTRDRRLWGGALTMERVFVVEGASCMVHASELNAHGQAVKQSEYRCNADGNTRARDSVDLATGWRNRVSHFGGNIEARPDEDGGVLIIRVPLVGTQVIFEDPRSLDTGGAIPERSAYLHKDTRGSVVAETYPDGSAGHDPVNNIDSTGNFVETAVDVASFAASVNTVRNWNSKTSFWTKVVDVVAVVADGAAVVVPGAPAVVGHAVRGTRAITNAVKGADRAVDVANTVDKGVDVARARPADWQSDWSRRMASEPQESLWLRPNQTRRYTVWKSAYTS